MESEPYPRWYAEQDGLYWSEGAPAEVWPRERDLVDWLIGNLGELGRVLGLRLVLAGREVGVSTRWQETDSTGRQWWVGGRRLDLDLRDERGRRVIVEAQLGDTDHGHLGQVVAYAVHADADVAVWLVAANDDDTPFGDHLDALAELNEIYAGRREFVVVEAVVETVRSPIAAAVDGPLLPRLRRVDLTTMGYAAEPGVPPSC